MVIKLQKHLFIANFIVGICVRAQYFFSRLKVAEDLNFIIDTGYF
jgi:hypothetical protein